MSDVGSDTQELTRTDQLLHYGEQLEAELQSLLDTIDECVVAYPNQGVAKNMRYYRGIVSRRMALIAAIREGRELEHYRETRKGGGR